LPEFRPGQPWPPHPMDPIILGRTQAPFAPPLGRAVAGDHSDRTSGADGRATFACCMRRSQRAGESEVSTSARPGGHSDGKKPLRSAAALAGSFAWMLWQDGCRNGGEDGDFWLFLRQAPEPPPPKSAVTTRVRRHLRDEDLLRRDGSTRDERHDGSQLLVPFHDQNASA